MLENNIQKNYWEGKEKRFLIRCHRYIEGPEHPIFRAISEVTLGEINKHIKLDNDLRILDVGCGSGALTLPLSKISSRIIGIDFSDLMLKKNPCNYLINADASLIPFKNESFDLVFCSDLLHHLRNPDAVVREMARTSRKYIILIEPDRNNLGNFIDSLITKEERLILRSSKKFLINLAEVIGLKIICCYSFGMLFPNVTPLWAIGILKRIKRLPFCGRQILLIAYKN